MNHAKRPATLMEGKPFTRANPLAFAWPPLGVTWALTLAWFAADPVGNRHVGAEPHLRVRGWVLSVLPMNRGL